METPGIIGVIYRDSRYPKQVLAKFLSIIDPAAHFLVDEMVWGLSRQGPLRLRDSLMLPT